MYAPISGDNEERHSALTGPPVLRPVNLPKTTMDAIERLREWIIPGDRLKLEKELGRGSVGTVYFGYHDVTEVAVKGPCLICDCCAVPISDAER